MRYRTWLARAADAYLKARARAGLPIPLSWRKGRFRVELQGGEAELPGFVSMPFGAFRGTAMGRGVQACHQYTLNADTLGAADTEVTSLVRLRGLGEVWKIHHLEAARYSVYITLLLQPEGSTVDGILFDRHDPHG